MTDHEKPPTHPDSPEGLAEIMETVEKLEARLRASRPVDLDELVDLINLLRMQIVSTITGCET